MSILDLSDMAKICIKLRTKLRSYHLNIHCSIWSCSDAEEKVPMLQLINMLTNATQRPVYVESPTLCALIREDMSCYTLQAREFLLFALSGGCVHAFSLMSLLQSPACWPKEKLSY